MLIDKHCIDVRIMCVVSGFCSVRLNGGLVGPKLGGEYNAGRVSFGNRNFRSKAAVSSQRVSRITVLRFEERGEAFGFDPVFDNDRQLVPCNVNGLYRCFKR